MTDANTQAGQDALRACAYCGEELRHVETWARSFSPARLYHEYHHDNVDCIFRKKCWSFSDDPKPRLRFIEQWNQRAIPTAESVSPKHIVAKSDSNGPAWCPTCGKDSDGNDCPKCAQWWKDNPPPTADRLALAEKILKDIMDAKSWHKAYEIAESGLLALTTEKPT